MALNNFYYLKNLLILCFNTLKMIPYSSLGNLWQLNKEITYLNHGSFGATPIEIIKHQRQLMDDLEAEPVNFMVNKLPKYLSDAKEALGNFVGTSKDNLFFVSNTTTGVNTVLKSLMLTNCDWLTTSHAYGACVNAFKFYAAQNNSILNIAPIIYPNATDDAILEAIENTITQKTKLALIDYVTSASAIIFPIKKIIALLKAKGILVIIDAAHAPGMVDFSIDTLDADFFVANCHKWICSPKGSAFVYVNPKHHHLIKPLVISHYNDTDESSASHWSVNFDWDGTHDYSAFIGVKKAIAYMPTLHKDGWAGIKKHNHELVWEAGNKIANALGVPLPVDKNMIGSILNIPMPNGEIPVFNFHYNPKLKSILYDDYKIEVPIFMFPKAPKQWLRISAQLYNHMEQYDYLINSLKKIFAK
jgi:isopenicillin-N epimerase